MTTETCDADQDERLAVKRHEERIAQLEQQVHHLMGALVGPTDIRQAAEDAELELRRERRRLELCRRDADELDTKSVTVTLRIAPAERDFLAEAAKVAGYSMSQLLREGASDLAGRFLERALNDPRTDEQRAYRDEHDAALAVSLPASPRTATPTPNSPRPFNRSATVGLRAAPIFSLPSRGGLTTPPADTRSGGQA